MAAHCNYPSFWCYPNYKREYNSKVKFFLGFTIQILSFFVAKDQNKLLLYETKSFKTICQLRITNMFVEINSIENLLSRKLNQTYSQSLISNYSSGPQVLLRT